MCSLKVFNLFLRASLKAIVNSLMSQVRRPVVSISLAAFLISSGLGIFYFPFLACFLMRDSTRFLAFTSGSVTLTQISRSQSLTSPMTLMRKMR